MSFVNTRKSFLFARNPISTLVLGLSFCFAHVSAWAVCAGDTVISTNVTTQQDNVGVNGLCSFTVTSNGSISNAGLNNHAIFNASSITTLSNAGSISTSNAYAIENFGSITTLSNTGSISASAASAIHISNMITTLNNTGTISGSPSGIDNWGSFTTLNNQQGRTSNTIIGNPLTFSGALPTNYNIIIASGSNYGQLSVSSVIGNTTTTFGVSSQSTLTNSMVNTTLSSVLIGVPSASLNNKSFISNGYTFGLIETSTSGTWDLRINSSLAVAASASTINVNGTTTLSTSGGGGSGNVSYTRVSGPCSLSGSTVTGTAAGSCIVTATKAADSTYAAETTSQLTITITASSSSPIDITPGTTVSLSSIGVSAIPVLSGGTVVTTSGDSYSGTVAVFASGGTIQSPTSGSAMLSGVISGSGGITFTGSGSGTTIITGANTYSGGTTVSGGTLSIAGTSPTGTGDVFVSSAGSLMGTGTIAGNTIVSGVLKPGNSPGHISMLSNFTLNSGATFLEDIAGTIQASSSMPAGASGYYSFVNVGGQMVINSGATLTPRLSNLFSASESGFGSPIYVPVLGNVFRIATASGGIAGRFATLTQPTELTSGTQLLAFYNVNNSNSLDLALVPTSYSTQLAGNTPAVLLAASVLDQWVQLNQAGSLSAAQNQLLFGVASQTAANLPAYVQAHAAEIQANANAPIPTLSEWAMIFLASLMAMFAFGRLRRKV